MNPVSSKTGILIEDALQPYFIYISEKANHSFSQKDGKN
jgi:hypothetical protein